MTDNNSSSPTNTRMQFFMGLFATTMGLFVILISVDIIHADPQSIHAPRWVLTLVGVMFTFIGLHIFSTSFLSPREQRTPIIQWVRYFLILGTLTTFATIFLWTGFGSGEREFSGSGSIGFLTISGKGSDFIGRIVFGSGGILSALVAGYYAFTGARKIISNRSDHT